MKVISKALLSALGITTIIFAGGCAQEGLPSGMSPEDVIREALLNQTEYTESVFELKADADLEGEVEGEENSLDGTFSLSGSSNTETEEMSVVIDADAEMNGESFAGKIELRTTSDGVFIKIQNVNVSDEETQELVDLMMEDYMDQWVKLTFVMPDEVMESGYMDVDYEEGDTLPFKNIEYVGNEDVLGLNSYHFTAEIDEEVMLDMMQGADTSDAEQFFEAADIVGDVYVAVDEMVMTGFGGVVTLDDPEMNGKVNMTFKINPTRSESVETPEYEKEFTEEDMMGLMFGGAMMSDPSMMMDESMTEGTEMKDLPSMEMPEGTMEGSEAMEEAANQ
jgi:hypothetical protein